MFQSKGQTSQPFTIAEASFTFLLLLGVIGGTQNFTTGFVKAQASDAYADRVRNAAVSLSSYPEGHLGLNITGFKAQVDDGNLTLKYRGQTAEEAVEPEIPGVFEGPDTFKRMEGGCLRNKGGEIVLEVHPC